MERKFINRDILEWMIGYVVILAIIMKSILVPVIFLIPLFFVWRAINIKQLDNAEAFKDKLISKGTMKSRKIGYGLLLTLVAFIFMALVLVYKLYGEYYWLHYVAVPAANAIGDFFNSIVGLFHKMFAGWMGSYDAVVAEHEIADSLSLLERIF